MKENNTSLIKITMTAVITALVCVMTLVIRIPSPTKGYMNLGDCVVLFGGWLLGPLWGAVAGGIGSALADLFAGYPVYIPGTLIIKAVMAFVVALMTRKSSGLNKKHFRLLFIFGAFIAEAVMISGYLLYEAFAIGTGFIPALSGVFGNLMQGVLGVAGSYFLVEITARTGIMKIYKNVNFRKDNENE